ncbi:hypothetical protein [Flavobacterium sp.]|uniref:hypothetical protein n=1 Tax=Flavobacterium sp. TaxID=239 RepID=UPI003752BDC3
MRIVPSKLFIGLTALFCCNSMLAAPNPPPPIPPPPGLPIDGGVFVLVFISIVFAYYKLYYIKKASN